MSGFSFDDLEDLDEGANDAPAPSRFDGLEDLDAGGGQPSYGYDSQEKGALDLPDLPTGKPDTWLDTAKDTITGLGEGAYKGLGLNPRTLFGDGVGMQIQTAHSASPYAAGAGQLVGEAGIQTLAAPAALARAPIAMGAVSGALSGLGNSEGTLEERARAAGGGAAAGMLGGYIAGKVGGGLSSLLDRKATEYGEEQAAQGLIKRGAQAADLNTFDAMPGGQVRVYQDAKRLGVNGRPADAARQAEAANARLMAEREAIRAASPGAQVDPASLHGRIQQANPYPEVGSFTRASQRAANEAANAAPDMQAVDRLRDYYGRSGNFPSDKPLAQLRQGIHGAINDEMNQAISRVNPGAGDAWMQAGRDLNVGIELEDVARRSANKARMPSANAGDVYTGGLSALYRNNAPAVKESLYGTGAALARGGQAIGNAIPNGLPAALTGSFGGQSAADAPTPARISQTALDSLYSGGAELGPYKSQFAEAAGSPNPGAVQDLITRLTMTDPQFRTSLLPLLAKRAGTY